MAGLVLGCPAQWLPLAPRCCCWGAPRWPVRRRLLSSFREATTDECPGEFDTVYACDSDGLSVGDLCESDGECGLSTSLDNCEDDGVDGDFYVAGLGVGDLCEGDGECATSNNLDNCEDANGEAGHLRRRADPTAAPTAMVCPDYLEEVDLDDCPDPVVLTASYPHCGSPHLTIGDMRGDNGGTSNGLDNCPDAAGDMEADIYLIVGGNPTRAPTTPLPTDVQCPDYVGLDVGDLCEGDGECGTTNGVDNCEDAAGDMKADIYRICPDYLEEVDLDDCPDPVVLTASYPHCGSPHLTIGDMCEGDNECGRPTASTTAHAAGDMEADIYLIVGGNPTKVPTSAAPSALACLSYREATSDECPEDADIENCGFPGLEVGDLCETDGECGLDHDLDNCEYGGTQQADIYVVVAAPDPTAAPSTQRRRPSSAPSDRGDAAAATADDAAAATADDAAAATDDAAAADDATAAPRRPDGGARRVADNDAWHKVGTMWKNCSWVAEYPNLRCDTVGVDSSAAGSSDDENHVVAAAAAAAPTPAAARSCRRRNTAAPSPATHANATVYASASVVVGGVDSDFVADWDDGVASVRARPRGGLDTVDDAGDVADVEASSYASTSRRRLRFLRRRLDDGSAEPDRARADAPPDAAVTGGTLRRSSRTATARALRRHARRGRVLAALASSTVAFSWVGEPEVDDGAAASSSSSKKKADDDARATARAAS
ncbi:hypothetical protein JL720_10173 [Aureococcus anophagefferens]|nr:hypothetical protein JL720_10173 [Aureococcus anophagefferens]